MYQILYWHQPLPVKVIWISSVVFFSPTGSKQSLWSELVIHVACVFVLVSQKCYSPVLMWGEEMRNTDWLQLGDCYLFWFFLQIMLCNSSLLKNIKIPMSLAWGWRQTSLHFPNILINCFEWTLNMLLIKLHQNLLLSIIKPLCVLGVEHTGTIILIHSLHKAGLWPVSHIFCRGFVQNI